MTSANAKTVTSVGCRISIPAGARHSVSVEEPGRDAAFDVATVLGETVLDVTPHPDGVLVRVGGLVGKVRRLDSGAWSYTELTDWHDLELADVDQEDFWIRAFRGPRST